MLLLAALPSARAATVWNEAINGDFANNGLTPTAVTFAAGPGVNTVLGSTGNSGSGVDRDYFTFVVPSGTVLSALKLLNNTAVSGGVSFIGIQPGPQVTVSTSGAGAENLIALGHYGNDQIGQDILPSIRVGSGPLPAGTYTAWVQDTGGPATYGFDFVITAVAEQASADAPLPAWMYIALAVALISLLQFRSRHANS
jgi:hypothetical protein